MNSIKANGYTHPETLVETGWLAEHLNDANQRIVEVDVDPQAYRDEHIPGAVGWNWKTDTQDTLRRDIPDEKTLEGLLSRSGITPEMTVILYGDTNNWFAAYALWLLKLVGHKDVRLLNGGRTKWLQEKRVMSRDGPGIRPARIRSKNRNDH
jgi:thiosulfate/3-mercaptopyruvate sulfurtransferase